MIIDTIDRILDTHERQGAPTGVIAETRSLRAAEDTIDRKGYRPDIAAKHKGERRAEYVATVVQQLRDLEADAAKQTTIELELHDRTERERVHAADGHGAVDLDRVRVATSPAELAVLLRDAMAYSPEGARRAWGFIEPRLREMAAREQRTHVMGTSATAFNLLCRLQMEMRDLVQRSPDRASVSAAADRRRRELRQQVLAVARTVGLDQAVEAAARKAALPPKPESPIVSGKWFDQFRTRK